jgi:hypothetical protein
MFNSWCLLSVLIFMHIFSNLIKIVNIQRWLFSKQNLKNAEFLLFSRLREYVHVSEYLLMFYYLSTKNSHVYNLRNLHPLTKFIPPPFFQNWAGHFNLGMLKGLSEAVIRRRTDNTIAERKGQNDKQRSTKHFTGN